MATTKNYSINSAKLHHRISLLNERAKQLIEEKLQHQNRIHELDIEITQIMGALSEFTKFLETEDACNQQVSLQEDISNEDSI